MNPSILSYYPTYSILDEVLTSGNYDTLNLYIDVKNTLQSLFMKHCILEIVENTLTSGSTDSSIFESVLHFISFHKMERASSKIIVIKYDLTPILS